MTLVHSIIDQLSDIKEKDNIGNNAYPPVEVRGPSVSQCCQDQSSMHFGSI